MAASCPAAETVPAPAPAPAPEVLDLDETAALLRVAPEVVRELAVAQRIPARRVGESWRFSRSALLAWLNGGDAGGAPPPRATAGGADDAATPDVRGRGRGSAVQVAQAGPATAAAPAAAPPTVGERPAAPTAEEVALRDQRSLLGRGAASADLGLSYAYSEQTLFPVVRQEQRTFGATATLRYGLGAGLQATARLPEVWRRTRLYADAAAAGAVTPAASRDRYTGDASLSLLGVAVAEGLNRPQVLWSLDAVLPSGPGDRALGGGLVLSKSYDPAVVFAGISYLRGLAIDPADARRTLARHNVGLSLGYTYALNDALALDTVFVSTLRNYNSADGVSIAPPREHDQLQLGLTWLLSPGLFVAPGVSLRLGGESADLGLALNLSQSF